MLSAMQSFAQKPSLPILTTILRRSLSAEKSFPVRPTNSQRGGKRSRSTPAICCRSRIRTSSERTAHIYRQAVRWEIRSNKYILYYPYLAAQMGTDKRTTSLNINNEIGVVVRQILRFCSWWRVTTMLNRIFLVECVICIYIIKCVAQLKVKNAEFLLLSKQLVLESTLFSYSHLYGVNEYHKHETIRRTWRISSEFIT